MFFDSKKSTDLLNFKSKNDMKNLKPFLIILSFAVATNLSAQDYNLSAEQTGNTPTSSFSKNKTNLKTNLLSPFLEYLDFSIERNFAPNYSAELKFGIIGVGVFSHETETVYRDSPQEEKISKVSKGYFLEGGIKYFFSPQNVVEKPSLKEGFYLKPSIIFGKYERNLFEATDRPEGGTYIAPLPNKETVKYQAFLLNVGIQYHLTSRLFLDVYIAGGIGHDNLVKQSEDAFLYYGEFHRGLHKTNGGTSFASKAGINLGFKF